MKNFKNLNFGGNEVLQRNQMKSVLGGNHTLTDAGDGSDTCSARCLDGSIHDVTSCARATVDTACENYGGIDICSGSTGCAS